MKKACRFCANRYHNIPICKTEIQIVNKEELVKKAELEINSNRVNKAKSVVPVEGIEEKRLNWQVGEKAEKHQIGIMKKLNHLKRRVGEEEWKTK